MNINKYLKCGIVLGALVYSVGTSIPTQSTYADEINTETVVKEWKPEGKVIATGEDGVPWELYENGYLLFKPEPGKDTLSNQKDGEVYWKTQNLDREKIKAIGFTNKVYLPEDSSNLFSVGGKGETLLNTGVKFLDTNKIDTSKVKNMSGMFGKTVFTKLDLNNWNTSNVEDMSHLFEGSSGLTELKIDKWDTSKVKNMIGMFTGLWNIKELNISNWNTSNVEDMSGMFSHLHDLLKLDLNKWNTSKVKNMPNMFWKTESLTTLNITNWDTSNVENMSQMFSETNLTELNISDWNISKVESMDSMFANSLNIKKLDLGRWNTSNVDNMNNIFQGTSSLTYLDLSNWNTTKVSDNDNPYMFLEAKTLTHLKIGNKFTNSQRNNNIFALLNEHNYGDKYTEKWSKLDNTTPFYTVDEWDKEYKANPDKLSGMWVREKNYNGYNIKFETGTDETIEPLEIEIGKDFELPVPTKIKEGYHFVGWTKTQDGEIIKDKNNLGKKNETVMLYAKWKKTLPVSSNTPNDENNNPILPPTVNELPEYNGGVNPTDSLINEKPEYKGTLSTNTPVDENDNLILPPIVDELPEFNGGVNSIEPPVEEKPEYTGQISTNTPVDDNGDLITPPTVEKPEYKEPVSTNTPVDNNGDSILSPTVEKAEYKDDLTKEPETSKEETKPVESKKEKELPNTNSTSILTTLVSSVIGTLGLGYKSKRRK